MKKINNILLILCMNLIINNFDKCIIVFMKIIDSIGYKYNLCVIDIIDFLNTIYYMLGYK